MVVHYNVIVKGKVQGVAYRASAIDMAIRLGVNGFVKNNRDGSVSCEIEGEEEMLHRFIQWCHHGPERAEVEHVSITEGDVRGYTSFEMRM